jgi:hypothetical protein
MKNYLSPVVLISTSSNPVDGNPTGADRNQRSHYPWLWDMLEEYLLDDMELVYNQEGTTITATIGEYVESLLTEDRQSELQISLILWTLPLKSAKAKVAMYLKCIHISIYIYI